MGGYSTSSNKVQQSIDLGIKWSLRCQPAYYKGKSVEYIYIWSEKDNLRAFPFDRTSGNWMFLTKNFVYAGAPQGAMER